MRYPLLDVGLFRSGGFSAAAATVFLTGIALFGSMILLPLYYQIARGESPLIAGLLVAPQGLGAALGMNLGGRATDRYGGGRVVVVGLILLLAGTAIFTQVGATTSYWLIGAALVLRGIGLGGSMMPAMAGAYATLTRNQVPRATPALNVLQRVGGSIGAALLIVILQNRIISTLGEGAQGGVSGATLPDAARARVADPLAEAFAHTYWYALALTAVALDPGAGARTRGGQGTPASCRAGGRRGRTGSGAGDRADLGASSLRGDPDVDRDPGHDAPARQPSSIRLPEPPMSTRGRSCPTRRSRPRGRGRGRRDPGIGR